ncbi:MAG: 8-oxoguanine deaminase [Anaerolineae bacterium]|nr:8-oxoguanine deaminase [Anaerolineae bacterium]CAG1013276.1 5-methylthioadenosine/S-adenosylhomocysteine deaminase [Anaerolineae bacterium]
MTKIFLKNAYVLATFDDEGREISDGAVIIRDNVIEAVGPTAQLAPAALDADEVIDLSDHVLMPGMVNTHHHMYQSLTRVIPGGQNAELFDWLRTLYPMWARLTPEMITTSALTAMAELILSGCTTATDHLYIYPNGIRLDDEIQAAQEIGIRFHPTRGSMSMGESSGGLPPDRVVEREPDILKETQRLIETYHDPSPYSMLKIAVAPCSPFSVTQDLMRESASLARSYGVRLHTHLAETVGDVAYSKEKFGLEPAAYAEDVGWVGHDVWHAHCVCLSKGGIDLFARTGTGVAHCPSSNMRLASGIAPVRQMIDAGVKVGLGVDGSASNDSGHLLAEARLALLLQRVKDMPGNPAALTAREALRIATRGGAAALGYTEIGQLTPGMAADMVAFDLNQVGFAGALHDPLAALVFCASAQVNYSLINGRVIVREGHLTTVDLGPVLRLHNHYARQLSRGE